MTEPERIEIQLGIVQPTRFTADKFSGTVTLRLENSVSVDIPISGDFERGEFPLDALLQLIDNEEFVSLQLVVYK